MLKVLEYVFLGALQGVTEWLPISSDGHLLLFENWLGLRENLAFDVFLHLASLIALGVFFWPNLRRLVAGFFRSEPGARRTVGFLILATAITAVVGLLLEPSLDFFRSQPRWVALPFLATAVIVYLTRWGQDGNRLTWIMVAILGAAQGLAVLPGLSRSGLTISLAVLLGLPREDAFRFSFLMAIPAIAAAVVYKAPDLVWNNYYWFGFVATLVVSFAALRLLRSVVRQNTFYRFAYYTLALAALVAIL